MDLKSYLLESEKQYFFRIKSIVPIDDDVMDTIENTLVKYQPLDISRPYKTILQKHPLDFANIENAEVWIIDIVLGLPVAPHILRSDIRKTLDAPESFIVVKNQSDATEYQTQLTDAINEIEAEAVEKGLKPAALLNDATYAEYEEEDQENLVGGEYVKALLGYLEQVRKEREDLRVQHETAPFNWLDLPDKNRQDDTNFNADIKDVPEIVPTSFKKKTAADRSVLGSIDQSNHVVKRSYLDAKGNRVVLSRKIKGIEK